MGQLIQNIEDLTNHPLTEDLTQAAVMAVLFSALGYCLALLGSL